MFIGQFLFFSGMQSGFRSGYGCVIATLNVLNDVIISLDSKQCCAAIFIDLAKAFDTVDYSILMGRLSIGVSEGPLACFANYLSQRVQCIKSENLLSQSLPFTKGVTQGWILGPKLFSIHINNIAQVVGSSLIHLYTDDSLIHSWPLPGSSQCSTTKLY
jgi:hypothetical protein